MSYLLHEVTKELANIVSTQFGLSGRNIVTKATKMARYDWRDLLQMNEDSSSTGIDLPMAVMRFGKSTPADWGLSNKSYNQPVDIILVAATRERQETTITVGVNNATQTVASTTGMFVGQQLYFNTADVWRRITAINSPNITLDAAVNTTTNERVFSEVVTDVESLLEKLRDYLSFGTAFTSFQVIEEPSIDVSDTNYVNQVFYGANYPLFAGILSYTLLYGETYD